MPVDRQTTQKIYKYLHQYIILLTISHTAYSAELWVESLKKNVSHQDRSFFERSKNHYDIDDLRFICSQFDISATPFEIQNFLKTCELYNTYTYLQKSNEQESALLTIMLNTKPSLNELHAFLSHRIEKAKHHREREKEKRYNLRKNIYRRVRDTLHNLRSIIKMIQKDGCVTDRVKIHNLLEQSSEDICQSDTTLREFITKTEQALLLGSRETFKKRKQLLTREHNASVQLAQQNYQYLEEETAFRPEFHHLLQLIKNKPHNQQCLQNDLFFLTTHLQIEDARKHFIAQNDFDKHFLQWAHQKQKNHKKIMEDVFQIQPIHKQEQDIILRMLTAQNFMEIEIHNTPTNFHSLQKNLIFTQKQLQCSQESLLTRLSPHKESDDTFIKDFITYEKHYKTFLQQTKLYTELLDQQHLTQEDYKNYLDSIKQLIDTPLYPLLHKTQDSLTRLYEVQWIHQDPHGIRDFKDMQKSKSIYTKDFWDISHKLYSSWSQALKNSQDEILLTLAYDSQQTYSQSIINYQKNYEKIFKDKPISTDMKVVHEWYAALLQWEQKKRDAQQTPSIQGLGLPNLGVTCYFNSVLQIIFHTPLNLLIQSEHELTRGESLSSRIILQKQLRRLRNLLLLPQKYRHLLNDQIRRIMDTVALLSHQPSHVFIHEQQDVSELLQNMIHWLEGESLTQQSTGQEQNIIMPLDCRFLHLEENIPADCTSHGPIRIFQISRSLWTGTNLEKFKDPIQKLPYLDDARLVGSIVHLGEQAFSGHYIAMTHDQESTTTYNDSLVAQHADIELSQKQQRTWEQNHAVLVYSTHGDSL